MYDLPIAGFFGSLTSILISIRYSALTKNKMLSYISRLVAGVVSGHYLTPLFTYYLHVDDKFLNSSSFIIGMCITQVVSLIHRTVHKELDTDQLVDLIKKKNTLNNN